MMTDTATARRIRMTNTNPAMLASVLRGASLRHRRVVSITAAEKESKPMTLLKVLNSAGKSLADLGLWIDGALSAGAASGTVPDLPVGSVSTIITGVESILAQFDPAVLKLSPAQLQTIVSAVTEAVHSTAKQ